MGAKQAKQTIKTFDLFSRPATFRYGEQPQYKSFTGGITSIILFIALLSIFMNSISSTFDKVDIDYKTTVKQQQDPTQYKVGTTSFMFAVGISGLDMNYGNRWFQVYFQKRVYIDNNRTKNLINLQKCTKQQWTRISQRLGSIYDRLNFDTWLCPQNQLQIELQGKYSSSIFKHYKIGVKPCKNSTDKTRSCVDNQTIQNFLLANQTFTFNFYYINTIINSGNTEFLQIYLDDLNYFPFSPVDGMTGNFFLSSYQVITDQSIYPYNNFQTTKGGLCSDPTQRINYKVMKNDDYIKFYIRKSSQSISIKRAFKKIDITLSYIGGLFSSIISVLIIMVKYNEASYEIQIAKNLYHINKNQPIKSEEFSLFTFLGYCIYILFTTININLNWPKMEQYRKSLVEVRKQMDMRLIMKKIQYFQRTSIAVFDQQKAKILHLQEPLTLEQANQIRKGYRFYERLQQHYFDYDQIKKQQQNKLVKFKGVVLQFEDFNNQDIANSEQITSQSNKQKNQVSSNAQQRYQINSSNSPKKLQNNSQISQKNQESIIQQGLLSKLTKFVGNFCCKQQNEKQKQLLEMIEDMKKCINALKMEAQNGDKVSQKILKRFDPKLMRMFIQRNEHLSTQENEKKSHEQLTTSKIDQSNIRLKIGKKRIQIPSKASKNPTK